jgi:hypothetical protein
MLDLAPCHEEVWRSGSKDPRVLNLCTVLKSWIKSTMYNGDNFPQLLSAYNCILPISAWLLSASPELSPSVIATNMNKKAR